MLRCGERAFYGALFGAMTIVGFCGGLLLNLREETGVGNLRRRFFPLCAERSECLLRLMFGGSCDSDEVAITNGDNAGQGFSIGIIARDESRTERWRTQDFTVEHAGASHVRRVLMRAGDEGAAVHFGDGLAGDGPLGGWSDGIFGGKILREGFATGELGVG